MSRKVTLTVPVDIVIRDRDVHVLALVKKRSGASSHGVSASIRSFADELDVSLRHRASCPCFVRGGGLSDGESQPHEERWSA